MAFPFCLQVRKSNVFPLLFFLFSISSSSWTSPIIEFYFICLALKTNIVAKQTSNEQAKGNTGEKIERKKERNRIRNHVRKHILLWVIMDSVILWLFPVQIRSVSDFTETVSIISHTNVLAQVLSSAALNLIFHHYSMTFGGQCWNTLQLWSMAEQRVQIHSERISTMTQ